MKLNRKGYMMVEIILAFALAMGVALYLLNLTYDFKNMNEDIYQDITYSADVISITKNIMNDLDRVNSGNIICNNTEENGKIIKSVCDFNVELKKDDTKENRRLQIEKSSSIGTTITYGKIENGIFVESDVSYYIKTLQKSLVVSEIKVEQTTDEKYLTVIIPVQSLYDDKSYDVKLLVSTLEGVLPENFKIIYHSNYPEIVTLEEATSEQEVPYVVSTVLNSNSFQISDQTFEIIFDDSFLAYGDCIESDVEGTFDNCSPDQEYSSQAGSKSSIRKFEFLGWAASADGEVVYQDGVSVSQTVKLLNNQLDLYAKWEVTDFEQIQIPVGQVIDGWEFAGWSSVEDDLEAQYVAGSYFTPTNAGSITLYAVYLA